MPRTVFRPQDILDLKSFGQLRLSPDGGIIVYEVKENDLNTDSVKTNLWWVNCRDDSDPRQISFDGKSSSPSWSHDGRRLAFTSGRSGKGQIFILDRRGGEASMIATERSPGSDLLWSPDDRYIAFLSSVEIELSQERYPGEPEPVWRKAAEDLAARREPSPSEQKAERKASLPRVITDLPYRRDGVGFIYERPQQLFVLDLQEGSCRQLTEEKRRIGDVAWTAEGKLIYVVQHFDIVRQQSEARFCRVDMEGRMEEVLELNASVFGLKPAPDGRGLLFNCSTKQGGTRPQELRYWPYAGKETIILNAGMDRSLLAASWSKDGGHLYALKQDRGQMKLSRFRFEGDRLSEERLLGMPKQLGNVTAYSLSENGDLAFLAEGFATPPQIYLIQGSTQKRMSALNRAYLHKDFFNEAEILHYQGADGWPIEGFLIKPVGYQPGRSYPTVVAVHGGPTGFFNRGFQPYMQMLAHHGYAVLFVNPRGSTSYGEAFADGVIGDWGGKDFLDIMAGVDLAVMMGVADPTRLGLMGWSYGGFMTCWGVTQTDRFKAAVGGANISSVYNLYCNCDTGTSYDEVLLDGPAFDNEELNMQHSALRHVRRVVTPILLLHGEADSNCPTDQSDMFYAALKRLGKEAVYVRYPGQPHGLRRPLYIRDRWLRTLAWFDHYLKP